MDMADEVINERDLIDGWQIVIGMEVHAQVTSESKLFSGASTEFGGEPNSHVSLVDAAMPGMLPVINEECVRQAVRTGYGLNAEPNLKSVFDRKNYFYPDLPQGYQISQYKSPIVGEGYVVIDIADDKTKKVRIERLHLEQDAGKLLHERSSTQSYVDLNRAGVALMEIVTRPDLRSFEQAMNFMVKVRAILRYLGTCDGDMEKGSLRADVNVSVRRPGAPLGTRCEIKNLNSINFIGQAINAEAHRQIEKLQEGGSIEQETRLYDPDRGQTRPMRSKEEAHDYRYFPDPDLLPLELSPAFVANLKATLPELPDSKKSRYISEWGLSAYDASVLVSEKEMAKFFENMVGAGAAPKAAANWVINVIRGQRNKTAPELLAPLVGPVGPYSSLTNQSWSVEVMGPTGPAANTAIVKMTSSNVVSSSSAKLVFETLWDEALRLGRPIDDPSRAEAIVDEQGIKQTANSAEIERVIDQLLERVRNNPKEAKNLDAVKANPNVLGWFVGEVRKLSRGADPRAVNDLLKKKLGL